MKPQNSDPHAVREKVRAGYSQIALHGSERRKPSCCCGMSAVDSEKLARQIGYSAGELSILPDGANIGLSCGNPGALAALRPGEVLLDLGVGGMVIALPVAEAERMVPALQEAVRRAKERQATQKH